MKPHARRSCEVGRAARAAAASRRRGPGRPRPDRVARSVCQPSGRSARQAEQTPGRSRGRRRCAGRRRCRTARRSRRPPPDSSSSSSHTSTRSPCRTCTGRSGRFALDEDDDRRQRCGATARPARGRGRPRPAPATTRRRRARRGPRRGSRRAPCSRMPKKDQYSVVMPWAPRELEREVSGTSSGWRHVRILPERRPLAVHRAPATGHRAGPGRGPDGPRTDPPTCPPRAPDAGGRTHSGRPGRRPGGAATLGRHARPPAPRSPPRPAPARRGAHVRPPPARDRDARAGGDAHGAARRRRTSPAGSTTW